MKISPISLAILITWAIVLFVWVVGAFTSKRTSQRQSGGSRLAHIALLFSGTCLLAFHGLEHGWLAIRFVPDTDSYRLTGLGITIIGAFFAIWARFSLGTNWSGRITLKEDHTLIATGPYAFVRHPIYSGMLLAFSGTAVFEGTLRGLLGVILILATYILKIRREEMLMTQRFPEDYPAYRRRVKALIPGLL